MWPLIIISFIGLVIGIERVFYLHKDQIRTGEFLSGIKNLLRKRRLLEALTVCEETQGPIAKVVKAALLNYNQPENKMYSAIQTAAFVEIPNLERRVGSVATIAKIAPLIGLLGTIISLIHAFSKFQQIGAYASSSLFSESIAQALITTGTGLVTAIIAYLIHHFLLGRIRTLIHDMEWVGHDIMQFLLRDLPEEETSSHQPAHKKGSPK